MASADRAWMMVMGLGLTATALVGIALGAVLMLWAVDTPLPAMPLLKPAAGAPPPPTRIEPAPVAATEAPPAAASAIGAAPAVPAAAAPPVEVPPVAASPPVRLAAALPYTVQFGAFAEMDRAQRLAGALRDSGQDVQVEGDTAAKTKGHALHYVRLTDGYRSRAEAWREAASLKRNLDIDTVPVRRDGEEESP